MASERARDEFLFKNGLFGAGFVLVVGAARSSHDAWTPLDGLVAFSYLTFVGAAAFLFRSRIFPAEETYGLRQLWAELFPDPSRLKTPSEKRSAEARRSLHVKIALIVAPLPLLILYPPLACVAAPFLSLLLYPDVLGSIYADVDKMDRRLPIEPARPLRKAWTRLNGFVSALVKDERLRLPELFPERERWLKEYAALAEDFRAPPEDQDLKALRPRLENLEARAEKVRSRLKAAENAESG